MRIRCWGARGSLPVSGAEFGKYGGNTTCLDIRASDGTVIVIDAGSGIRKLGNTLIKEGISTIHMLFTHVHWDHVIGFPFFNPIYIKNMDIRIFGSAGAQNGVKTLVSRTMEHPFFPVPFDQVPSKIDFLGDYRNSFEIGSLKIDTIILNHPQNGLGYRFTENNKSFVFLTDNELSYKHPEGLEFDDYMEFSKGADLFFHDAEYRKSEYTLTRSWGHSLYSDATELAIAAGVGQYGLFHHNIDRADDDLDSIVEECTKILAYRKSKIKCFAVSQGMEFNL